MERRFYLGVGVLVVFLVLGLIASFGLAHIHEPIADTLAQASQAALTGDLAGGTQLAQQAESRWHAFWKTTASVADHTPMDEIDSLFAEMTVFAQAEDAEHFAACCAQLAKLVQSVADAHNPGWQNLL